MTEQMWMGTWGCMVAIVCICIGWLLGSAQRHSTDRAEDQRIAAAVDQLDAETLEPLPFDQEALPRRRDQRRGTR